MTELAHRRPQSVAEHATVDYTKALQYLGLNPASPQAHALVLVCQRYELDPLLGHVSLYDGKPYVHFAGYLHIANSHPQFDGIECMREWETDTHYLATVRVHRSDRNYPAERTGRSAKLKRKKDGSRYEDDHADAKAFAQAARRALRMAFNVDHPDPSEDHSDVPTPAPAPVVEVARIVQQSGAGSRGPAGVSGDGASGTSPAPGNPSGEVASYQGRPPTLDPNAGEGSHSTAPGGTAGDPSPATSGPTSPVQLWCQLNARDIRHARVHLRRVHSDQFADLKDWRDLDELRPPRSDEAIKCLDAWVANTKAHEEDG